MTDKAIISLSEFKNDAAGWIKRLQKQPPVVLTQNGRGVAVVQSYEEFERARFESALLMRLNQALTDDRAGRSIPHAKVKKQIRSALERHTPERG